MTLNLGSKPESATLGPRYPGEPGRGLRLSLLGGFDLSLEGEIVRLPMTAQRLIAFLSLHDRPLLRGYVAGSLWPDTTEDRAGANLRSALWRLGSPGFALVNASNGHLELSPRVDVDLRHSIALAHRLRDQSLLFVEGEIDELRFFKDVLPDWSDDWVIVEREHFRQLRLHALESLCERQTALGRYSQAIEAGLAAVAAEPLRESAHRTLIKAHLAEGNVGEATRQYRTFRRLLHDELDLEPSNLMEALVRGLTLVFMTFTTASLSLADSGIAL
jgi:DNA-binding SARP family transcriptional activator